KAVDSAGDGAFHRYVQDRFHWDRRTEMRHDLAFRPTRSPPADRLRAGQGGLLFCGHNPAADSREGVALLRTRRVLVSRTVPGSHRHGLQPWRILSRLSLLPAS